MTVGNDTPLRHVDAYIQDTRVGSGQRQFVILEERGARMRLLYVPFVLAFWVKSRDLQIKHELTLKGLATRIRKNRAERRRRKRLNLNSSSWSVLACREALERLAGGGAKSAADQADDWADATFKQEDMDKEVTEMDDPKMAEETSPPAVAKVEAVPLTGGMADETETQAPNDGAEQQENDVAKTAKKAKTVSRGVKVKKPAKEKVAKASNGSTRLRGSAIITHVANENPGRADSHRSNVFDSVKIGATVAETTASVAKKYPKSAKAAAPVLGWLIKTGLVKVKAAAE